MSLVDRLRRVLGADPAEAPMRQLHFGVDFGTCWSKLVIRDYESPNPFAFVVRPGGADAGPGNTFRIPSAVTLCDERLYFGWPGQERAGSAGATTWTSLKMRAAFPDEPPYSTLCPLPDGLTPEDVAVLVVTYLFQLAMKAAEAYTANLRPACRPRRGVTMGAPMDLVSREHLQDRFVGIVRTAFELSGMDIPPLSDGVSPRDAAGLLAEARYRLAGKPETADPRAWVRSEVEAGLMWVVQSPRIAPGKYACIDIGAGTTDVSVFYLREAHQGKGWVKSSLLFYSAKSSLPGVDAIDHVICDATGESLGSVRGLEETRTAALSESHLQRLDGVASRIHDVYLRAWRDAYSRLIGESEWKDMGLFVLGGGAKISRLSRRMTETPWPGQLADRIIEPNDYPVDLYEAPSGRSRLKRFKDDANFLLVAYGLSFMASDVPNVDAPDAKADYNPPTQIERPLDRDEYYPK
ncbi:MAG: hypothetical protein AB7I50_19445 [Vicinamibacterales bacterium]